MRDALCLLERFESFLVWRLYPAELEGDFADVEALLEEAGDCRREVHADVGEKLLGVGFEIFVDTDGKRGSHGVVSFA